MSLNDRLPRGAWRVIGPHLLSRPKMARTKRTSRKKISPAPCALDDEFPGRDSKPAAAALRQEADEARKWLQHVLSGPSETRPESGGRPAAVREKGAIGENFAELDQSPTKKSGGCHATKFIGGKWKSLSTEAKDMYALRAVAELELYHVDKRCWVAQESRLQPEVRPLADSGLFSAETTKKKQKNIGGVPPWHPTVSTQPGLPVPDSGAFAHGIHEGNEKYRHILIFLI